MKKANPFEVLGISKELVTEYKSSDSLDLLLKHAKRIFSAHAGVLHSDINPNPVMGELYQKMADAMNELKTSAGFNLAVRWYVGEEDKAASVRRHESMQEAAIDREKLMAALGLLRNVSQFRVMGVKEPTSVMLQFGAARSILDVVSHDRTFLSLSATESADELPEQSDKPEYADGLWSEQFLNQQGKVSRYVHRPDRIGKVDIVGFVPAVAFKYRDDDDFQIHNGSSELGEGLPSLRMTPTWSSPETAWYLRKLVSTFTNGASVVVRHGTNGNLALAGVVQAQASLQQRSSKQI
jgi:hypothetical protein